MSTGLPKVLLVFPNANRCPITSRVSDFCRAGVVDSPGSPKRAPELDKSISEAFRTLHDLVHDENVPHKILIGIALVGQRRWLVVLHNPNIT